MARWGRSVTEEDVRDGARRVLAQLNRGPMRAGGLAELLGYPLHNHVMTRLRCSGMLASAGYGKGAVYFRAPEEIRTMVDPN